jgi:hypothetical protein
MLTLSRSYIHMEYDSINTDEIDALAEYAYESAEAAASEYLEVHPVGIAVRVEEGSIEIIVTIGAYASALFAAISGYGGFCDGLSRIKNHARLAGKFVSERILHRAKEKGRSRVTTGQVGKLQRLFRDVEAGRLTADKATQKALDVFVKVGEKISPELKETITKEFTQIPVRPSEKERIEFPPELVEHQPLRERKEIPRRRVRRRGVEIWRNPGEDKKNKRQY